MRSGEAVAADRVQDAESGLQYNQLTLYAIASQPQVLPTPL